MNHDHVNTWSGPLFYEIKGDNDDVTKQITGQYVIKELFLTLLLGFQYNLR